MKIDFESIHLERFKSFRDPTLFNLKKRGSGFHFIRGRNEARPRLQSNGAGKSTLWDALCWGLFGKTTDGLRNPDIVPWKGEGTTCVTAILRIDGVRHVINRTTKPNRLKLDEKDVGQPAIVKLIGLDYAIFTHTVLLGQGRPLFFDLDANHKMRLFSEVLDLDRWDQRSMEASKQAREMQSQADRLAGEYQGLQAQQDQLVDVMRICQQESEGWEKQQADLLFNADAELAKLRKIHDRVQYEHDGLNLQYDGSATELRALNTKYTESSCELDDLNAKYEKHRHKLEADKKERDRRLSQWQLLRERATCPTCGQTIKPADLKTHKIEVKKQLDEIETVIRQETRKATTITERRLKVSEAIQRMRKDRAEFMQKSQKAHDDLDHLTPRLHELKAQIKTLQDAKAQGHAAANPFRVQMQDLRRRKNTLEGARKDLQKQRELTDRKLMRRKFWIKGFRDVRLYIVEEILQELEFCTNAILSEVGLDNWQVQYAVEKETKSGTTHAGLVVSILSPDNKEPVRWESWSGGEGQRLRIVGALGLAEVLLSYAGVQPSMEVLDEPMQYLPEGGIKDLCLMLAERATQLQKQIWLIDHQAIESSFFKSVLTVVRTKKGSTLAKPLGASQGGG